MFKHIQTRVRSQDSGRLNYSRRFSLFERSFRKKYPSDGENVVDTYEISVEQCFVSADFDEENPLYLLDIGGLILILFGQWIFDPHTLVAENELFARWDCETAFFKNFSLMCFAENGALIQVSVHEGDFTTASRLAKPVRFKRLREYQFIPGKGSTLVGDLKAAEIIE